MKYRKKPVIIDAIQWTGTNVSEIIAFMKESNGAGQIECHTTPDGHVGIQIKLYTLEGTMLVSIMDYIIKGVDGEFYPCKPYIFEKTYEKAEE